MLTLAEDRLGVDWSYHFRDEDPGGGWFRVGDECVAFGDVSGVFVRFNPEPGFPDGFDVDVPEEGFIVAERRSALHVLLDMFPGVVVNRSRAGRSNGSKPLHMMMLAECGFAVPEWIVTNEPDEVAALSRRFAGDLVYKASSGMRSRVRAVDEDILERLRSGTTPAVFQRRIEGTDVRVHIVGNEAMAARVQNPGIDYRFESPASSSFTTIEAPPEIVARCIRFARAEDLLLAGFDFRVTPEGAWFCLEANPAPTFIVYEAATKAAIAEAILDLLTGWRA